MKYKEQQDILNREKINELLENLPDYVRYFSDECSANHKSTRTILGYLQEIDIFFYYLKSEKHIDNPSLEQIEKITALDLTGFKNFLAYYRRNDVVRKNGIKASNRKLIAVRQLFQFLYRMDLINDDPTKKMTLINDKKEKDAHEITVLNKDQVSRLIEAASTGNGLTDKQQRFYFENNLRDTAIIELLLSTGMRVSELVGLNLGDISYDEKALFITRKGHEKAQRIHISERMIDLLKDYIQNERKESEMDPDALFISRKGQRITVRSVERLVKKYSMAAGAGSSTPHKLRRTYGTELYSLTGDVFAVSNRLGHSSIETAKRHYVKESEEIDIKNAEMDLFGSKD